MTTISRLFLDRVAATPNARAFSSFHESPTPSSEGPKATWNHFAWRDFETQARAFGLGLASLGIKRGDVVAILGQTRHEWILSDIGAIGIGAITVGLYPTLAREGIGSMRYVLDHSEAKVLVVENAATFADKIAPIASQLKHVEHIILWDDVEKARALHPPDPLDPVHPSPSPSPASSPSPKSLPAATPPTRAIRSPGVARAKPRNPTRSRSSSTHRVRPDSRRAR